MGCDWQVKTTQVGLNGIDEETLTLWESLSCFPPQELKKNTDTTLSQEFDLPTWATGGRSSALLLFIWFVEVSSQ